MKISKIYRLVEARFPDEKFWNKDGTPIYPQPKGPPKGTVGKTHADVGVHDDEGAPELPLDAYHFDSSDWVKQLKDEEPDRYKKLAQLGDPTNAWWDEHGTPHGEVNGQWYVWDRKQKKWVKTTPPWGGD